MTVRKDEEQGMHRALTPEKDLERLAQAPQQHCAWPPLLYLAWSLVHNPPHRRKAMRCPLGTRGEPCAVHVRAQR